MTVRVENIAVIASWQYLTSHSAVAVIISHVCIHSGVTFINTSLQLQLHGKSEWKLSVSGITFHALVMFVYLVPSGATWLSQLGSGFQT